MCGVGVLHTRIGSYRWAVRGTSFSFSTKIKLKFTAPRYFVTAPRRTKKPQRSHQLDANGEISNSFGSYGTRKHTVKFSTGKLNDLETRGVSPGRRSERAKRKCISGLFFPSRTAESKTSGVGPFYYKKGYEA